MTSYSPAPSGSHPSRSVSARHLSQLEPAGPAINLCLLLPNALTPDGKVDLDLHNWVWVHVLVLPVDQLASLNFIVKPYKWIRFVAGAILGAHGHLSWSPDSADLPVDYDAALPTESQMVYYHCGEEERALMFPVDPQMARRSEDSIPCTAQFVFGVKNRDGGNCVITGMPEKYCRTAHIVPYSKGNAYIERLTSRRAKDGYDVISEIEDERNGVYMNKNMEFAFGDCVGLMKTPNFALTTCDIDPTANDADEERVSIHLLMASITPILCSLPNGSPVRLPTGENAEWWPPSCLLEASYGCAVLEIFGMEDAKEHISRVWDAQFHPDDPSKARMDEDGDRH